MAWKSHPLKYADFPFKVTIFANRTRNELLEKGRFTSGTSVHQHVAGHPEVVENAAELSSVQAGSCFSTAGLLLQKDIKLQDETPNLPFIDCGCLIIAY